MKVTSILPLTLIAVVAGQSACPGESATNGFTTIADINQAIAAHLSDIRAGSQPSPPYVFTLCPETVFFADLDQPLTATLSGAEFVCGKNGAVTDTCVIQGGANQVLIQDPSVSGYTLENVTFRGIAFDSSTESSIIANASSVTTATFIDCTWSSFSGGAAIQLSSTSSKAINVVINGGSVPSGTSTAIFSNDNGALDISGLNITGFDGVNGIVTLNGGVTTVQTSDISGLGPTGLDSLLSAAGSGTTLNVRTTTIRDISLPGVLWDGIKYSEGASGVVEGTSITRTSGLQFAISAISGSVVNVTNCSFEGNTAASGGFSSIYYALNSSKLNLLNDDVADNTGFFFYGFTGFQSYTSYENTTFAGGEVTLAVFIDQDSTFTLKNINFTNVQAQQCNPPDQQEFIEDVGSRCFYRGPGECTGKCGIITNNTFAPTDVPSLAPVAPPTVSPSAATPAPTAATAGPTTSPSVATTAPTVATVAPTTAPSVATTAPTAATVAPTTAPSVATLSPTAATVAPTISPSVATPAPIVETAAPTISPSVATPAPIAETAAPTIAPSAATSSPTATTETPSEVPAPETIAPTTSPLAPTNAPAAPSTSLPTANKSKPKKHQKGPKAKNGTKSAKKATTPGAGTEGKTKGAGKKTKSATRAPVSYVQGKGSSKGPDTGAVKTKGVPNKKPKFAKGNEGESKGGLAKKTTAAKTGGSYGTTKSKTAKTPGVHAGKKGSTPPKWKTEGSYDTSMSTKTSTTKTTGGAVKSGKKSSTATTSKGGSYGYTKPNPAKKPTLLSKKTPKTTTKGTSIHSEEGKKKATKKSGGTKKSTSKVSHPSTPSDGASYV